MIKSLPAKITTITSDMIETAGSNDIGRRESLAHYRKNTQYCPILDEYNIFKGFTYPGEADIEFDIHRQLFDPRGMDFKNFKYDVWISAFYSPSTLGPSCTKTRAALNEIDGTQILYEKPGFMYANHENMDVIFKIDERGWLHRNDSAIAISSNGPRPSLEDALEDAAYMVDIFNRLNPNRPVTPDVWERMVNLARENDKYFMGIAKEQLAQR